MPPALLIGGVASGCGKTTATLGLMAALKQQGLIIQGFKVGPDYIDPGLHAAITGRPSWNLDGWMGNRDTVRATFSRVMLDQALPSQGVPDIGIIEGVMGLFDGASGSNDTGSSAEIAAWLDVPVILVVDAKGMARSMGAIVMGYAAMRDDLRLAGIVATRVGSRNHEELLREALHSTCPDIPLLACLPSDERVSRPSRHLGLRTAETDPVSREQQAVLAEWFSSHADMPALLSLAASFPPLAAYPLPQPARKEVRIAVARDSAFCFMYPATLDALCQAGARIVFFSPLHDTELPACDGIWLPGGYPELYAECLSHNTSMAASVQRAVNQGIPVHGECGGYIWLMETLEIQGVRYPMLGCLPGTARLEKRRAALGYRTVRLRGTCALGYGGQTMRGHEFHYSRLMDDPLSGPSPSDTLPLWEAEDRKGRSLGYEGTCRGNVSGTWIHIHPDSDPGWAERFVDACLRK